MFLVRLRLGTIAQYSSWLYHPRKQKRESLQKKAIN